MYVRVQCLVFYSLTFVGSLLNTTIYFWVVYSSSWIISKMSLWIFQFHFSRTIMFPVANKKFYLRLLFLQLLQKLMTVVTSIHLHYFGIVVTFLFIFVHGITLLQRLFWVPLSIWIEKPYVKECFLATHLEIFISNVESYLAIRLTCLPHRLFFSI